ncbi:hypothetical protein O3P69_015418 [Scylla paramamosain]|uniref:Uncharacterized protein n=1 Tax=Scylla paramamosain TaxID=85552 RepID=A0AAW0T4B8_SCYPA
MGVNEGSRGVTGCDSQVTFTLAAPPRCTAPLAASRRHSLLSAAVGRRRDLQVSSCRGHFSPLSDKMGAEMCYLLVWAGPASWPPVRCPHWQPCVGRCSPWLLTKAVSSRVVSHRRFLSRQCDTAVHPKLIVFRRRPYLRPSHTPPAATHGHLVADQSLLHHAENNIRQLSEDTRQKELRRDRTGVGALGKVASGSTPPPQSPATPGRLGVHSAAPETPLRAPGQTLSRCPRFQPLPDHSRTSFHCLVCCCLALRPSASPHLHLCSLCLPLPLSHHSACLPCDPEPRRMHREGGRRRVEVRVGRRSPEE